VGISVDDDHEANQDERSRHQESEDQETVVGDEGKEGGETVEREESGEKENNDIIDFGRSHYGKQGSRSWH